MEVSLSKYNKIHPWKFMLWLSMASIIMMFTGWTSAYIVKRADTNSWVPVVLPSLFYVSSVIILVSSVTMHLALRSFKRNKVSAYKGFLVLTFLLGCGFAATQWMAWQEMTAAEITLGNVEIGSSGDFLYIISGAHVLHVLGGLIALLGFILYAFMNYRKPVDTLVENVDAGRQVRVELLATYWHFVDFLWLYLLIFLIANQA